MDIRNPELRKEMEKINKKIKRAEQKSKEIRAKGLEPCPHCGIRPISKKYYREHRQTARKEYLCEKCFHMFREGCQKHQAEIDNFWADDE